jgi:hypothetical protein
MAAFTDRCVFGLDALKDNDLIDRVDRIQTHLETTPEYSGLLPKTSEVRAVLTVFTDAYKQCANGNREEIAHREELRAELLKLMRKQLRGVNYIADGKAELLSKSGFAVQKRPEPSGIPPQATIVKVEPGPDLGSIMVTMKGFRNRKFYRLTVAATGEKPRTFEQSKPKFLVTGLEPGAEVSISARIHGAEVFGPVSRETNYFVPGGAAVVRPQQEGGDKTDMKVA